MTGIDLNSVRQIAGHSSISTTQRYIDDNPHTIANILKAIWSFGQKITRKADHGDAGYLNSMFKFLSLEKQQENG